MTLGFDREARRRDWVLYILLISAVLCLPLVIETTEWFPGASRLIWPALWATLLGVVLAHVAAGGLLSWLIAVVVGLEYSVQFAGKVLPSVGLILEDLGRYIPWLWNLVIYRTLGDGLPWSRALAYTGERLRTLFGGLYYWYAMVWIGEKSEDLTALSIGVVFGVWILAWNAGYQLFRRRSAFAALFPLGTAIVANVAFTDIGMSYVHFFLALVLLTLVRANVSRMEAIWHRLGLDFSTELKRDATVTGSVLAGAIVLVALLTPYITYSRAVWAFWDRYGQSFQDFYSKLDKAFAGRNPVPEPTPGGPGLAPHSVRTTGELSEDVVLLVVTSDPPPPPQEELDMIGPGIIDPEAYVEKHYWRERTYDTYTGSGWDTSERQEQTLAAGEPWGETVFPHRELTQTYRLVGAAPGLAFGVNEPALVDIGYRVVTRGPEDLAALFVLAEEYEVVSHVPIASLEDLQGAEEPYPDWVAERFLQLPNRLPERIRETTQQIIEEAGATTRYDKARAIETYLRRFDYDLNLEPPPLGKDVVDYFLFEAQRGYCDYSATAMVVMLRTVGVAARYASGYNMGSYDYGRHAWVVRERNAHAWTEVYFPGYGWIEFEPTPTQRVFVRSSTFIPEYGPLGPMAEPAAITQLPLLWVGGAILAFLVLFAIVWPPRWFRRRRGDPRQIVWRVYERLVRRARWAGMAPAGGQTPAEYLRALGREMERRASFAAGACEDTSAIEAVYLRARYSEGFISQEEGYRVEGAYRRLRGKLTRLTFVGASRNGARG